VHHISAEWLAGWRGGGLTIDHDHDQPKLWEDWLYNGGVEVAHEDVTAIDTPDYQPSQQDVDDVGGLDRWSLPMALAWIATADIAAVAQVLAPLTNFGRRRGQEAVPLDVSPDDWGSGRRALGWLHKTVAHNHCSCRAVGDDDVERWQRCGCTKAALRRLKDAIRSGAVVAIAQRASETGQALSREEVDYIAFDDRAFELAMPSGIDLIEFDAALLRSFQRARRGVSGKTTAAKSRGRPRGSSRLNQADDPYVASAIRLIKDGERDHKVAVKTALGFYGHGHASRGVTADEVNQIRRIERKVKQRWIEP
jgi:hypothetical protein